MRITVGNPKGGVSKTTTAIYLALALAREGRTLLVDADSHQTSAMHWASLADDWPSSCSVVALADRAVSKGVTTMMGDYEHLVIDTGAKSTRELRQALTVTDYFVIPVAPRALDMAELPALFDLAAEIDCTHPLLASVLFTQVRAGTRSAGETRAALIDANIPVFDCHVPLRESYALAHGEAPTDIADYRFVLDELKGWGNAATTAP